MTEVGVLTQWQEMIVLMSSPGRASSCRTATDKWRSALGLQWEGVCGWWWRQWWVPPGYIKWYCYCLTGAGEEAEQSLALVRGRSRRYWVRALRRQEPVRDLLPRTQPSLTTQRNISSQTLTRSTPAGRPTDPEQNIRTIYPDCVLSWRCTSNIISS